MWSVWLIYWWVAANRASTPVRQESWVTRLAHIGPLALAAVLLLPSHTRLGALDDTIFGARRLLYAISLPIVAAGLGFSIWARVTIGENWSGTVAIKEDHELIRKGPYHWIRHPIYTGILISIAGTALALDLWRSWLAVLIAFLSLWGKLKLEERWLGEHFGEQYRDYCEHTAALFPFIV